MFDWKWSLKELHPDKPVNVVSCFACGGGSSMGYKRAGFNVIANIEIDPKIAEVYQKNLHPKYSFVMDIREFNKLTDIPEELYEVDILDGSPPCSTFSTVGDREAAWGKEKVFREGQAKQTLDDLFFVFLETVEKLKPKIVVAENVTGLVKGNARGYVNEILKRFKELGYDVQLFQLNSALMNVPQKRERVFFIANRMNYPKLKLNFNERVIPFGEVRSEHGRELKDGVITSLMEKARPTDTDLAKVSERVKGKRSCFSTKITHDENVSTTFIATGIPGMRWCDRKAYSNEDIINISSFPQDYDFGGQNPQFICGMCVPPNMMANIAAEIWRQWIHV